MTFVPQFLILIVAVGVSFCDDHLCPSPEDLSPCTCALDKGYPNVKVVCKEAHNLGKVRRALQSLKGIRGVTVTFYECSLGWVPSDLFKGLHVTHVFFYGCRLEGFGDEGRSALEGLEDIVEKFTVSGTSFPGGEGLRFLNVSGLRKLERFDVQSNTITELGNDWFSGGPSNLQVYFVPNCKIERLGDRVFAQLTNIRELWLGYNRVGAPKRSMFPMIAGHLHTLHLSKNEISSLPFDMFLNMPALKIVYLDENFIQKIPEAIWTPVWSTLHILDLKRNPLQCDSSIEWTFRRRRPTNLLGKCVFPEIRERVDLGRVIDDKQSKE